MHLLRIPFWFVLLISFQLMAQQRPYRFTGDSVLFSSATTCRYTVDTPEGEGLVCVLPSIQEILNGLNKEEGEYRFTDSQGNPKTEGYPLEGDCLLLYTGKHIRQKWIAGIRPEAIQPRLLFGQPQLTAGTTRSLTLDFFAGQRSPMAEVQLRVPPEIKVTLDNTTVNVIGRGEVTLRELPYQSIGRTGTRYSYNKVGNVRLEEQPGKGTLLSFTGLDLRPDNGVDLRLCFREVFLPDTGSYHFEVTYQTQQPGVYRSHPVTAGIRVLPTIADLERIPFRNHTYDPQQKWTEIQLKWTPLPGNSTDHIRILQSVDQGKRWEEARAELCPVTGTATVRHLSPNRLYMFCISVESGPYTGRSNRVQYYSGLMDIKKQGVKGDGRTDETERINQAIQYMHELGGGILRFTPGVYPVRTLHLQSNVWLYVDKGSVIQALPGADDPESTWFSDRAYRSGLSPTDPRPYEDPENYLTKQDVGHTFFRNAMFFGERLDNVKIIGTGRITGNGNLVTTDRVMNNPPDKRADKMFSLKLCTQVEIGGLSNGKDLWYDPDKDIPYYIDVNNRLYDDSNMLQIDQGGHFVLLATGTDTIHVHNTRFARYNSSNARDIYDFMACNEVTVTNIYSAVSSDDIVKPGSDCSLGFTRPARNYYIRNIIGDTNCNLFQIGSETADDIQDLYVDNIYVLGANKAGFSISTNDGGHIKNVYLNSGKTGPIHSRSVMLRTRAPFFISISNRGRVLGAEVSPFVFLENGIEREELLVTNSGIGRVENVVIKGVDIEEVYGGSSFRGDRWKPYNGSQHEAACIIAGFKLPDPENILTGIPFRMPDGRHTGYIETVHFEDIYLKVKGGHPKEDAGAIPPEIGVGRYNVGDLKIQPAFGYWARHVKNLSLINCYITAEQKDGRYPVVLDDVIGTEISNLEVEKGITDQPIIFRIE